MRNLLRTAINAAYWWLAWYLVSFTLVIASLVSIGHHGDPHVTGSTTSGYYMTGWTAIFTVALAFVILPGSMWVHARVRRENRRITLAPLPPVVKTLPPAPTLAPMPRKAPKAKIPADYIPVRRVRSVEEHEGYTVVDRRRFGNMVDD